MLPLLSGSSQTPLITSSAPLEGFGVRNINMNGVGPILKTSQQPSPSPCFHPPIATAGLTNLQTWENNTRLQMNPCPPKRPAAEISSNSMPPPPPSTKLNLPPCTTNSTGSSSSMTYGSCPPSSSHSGSEEEEQQQHQQEQQQEKKKSVIDERKQKRMLSNRESARRSRMRKQQHLDELRAQVVQLRAENNHILTKFNLTSQQYLQLEEQNRVLRSQTIDLYQKLQALISIQQQQQQSLGNFDNSEFQNTAFC